jgi:hypothetical protein
MTRRDAPGRIPRTTMGTTVLRIVGRRQTNSSSFLAKTVHEADDQYPPTLRSWGGETAASGPGDDHRRTRGSVPGVSGTFKDMRLYSWNVNGLRAVPWAAGQLGPADTSSATCIPTCGARSRLRRHNCDYEIRDCEVETGRVLLCFPNDLLSWSSPLGIETTRLVESSMLSVLARIRA